MSIYGYALDDYSTFARDMYEEDEYESPELLEAREKLENIRDYFSHLQNILTSPLALDMDGLYRAIDEINGQLDMKTEDSTLKIARAIYPRLKKGAK